MGVGVPEPPAAGGVACRTPGDDERMPCGCVCVCVGGWVGGGGLWRLGGSCVAPEGSVVGPGGRSVPLVDLGRGGGGRAVDWFASGWPRRAMNAGPAPEGQAFCVHCLVLGPTVPNRFPVTTDPFSAPPPPSPPGTEGSRWFAPPQTPNPT